MSAGQAWLPAVDSAGTKPLQVEHLSFLPYSGILPRIETVAASGHVSRPRRLRHAGDACKSIGLGPQAPRRPAGRLRARPGNPVRKKKVPEVGEKDAHRDARGAYSRGSLKLHGRHERDRGPPGRPNRPAQAPPKAAPKDRQRSPGQTALSTQGCATVADNPGQSGPSLKLSRRSDGCQGFE